LEANRVYETRFQVNREWSNPFDADVVDLHATIETPRGVVHVPAFYSQDYTRHMVDGREELAPKTGFFWAVRFATDKPGHYRWFLEGKDRTGALGRTDALDFDVEPSRQPGVVRLDRE